MKTQTERIIIHLRRKVDVDCARRMGYTKNHFMVEGFMVGKWRLIGFYTTHQIAKQLPEARCQTMLKWNARGVQADEFKWEEVRK